MNFTAWCHPQSVTPMGVIEIFPKKGNQDPIGLGKMWLQIQKVSAQCIIETDGLTHGEMCKNEKVYWVVFRSLHRLDAILENHPYSSCSSVLFFLLCNFYFEGNFKWKWKMKIWVFWQLVQLNVLIFGKVIVTCLFWPTEMYHTKNNAIETRFWKISVNKMKQDEIRLLSSFIDQVALFCHFIYFSVIRYMYTSASIGNIGTFSTICNSSVGNHKSRLVIWCLQHCWHIGKNRYRPIPIQ